uniref:Uncharacterized protein n=1 Tax=Tetraodon nigroviridis TaxID=99883 RepID=H3CKQ5_TETNG
MDMDLLRKSRQHNLTSNNVRAILHEVITHEHVVSMMKAAIKDTQDQPMFEPKMTRSRLKQAGRYSQILPNWSLSEDTVRSDLQHPQFVDIDLKDDEDSSDEEYYPAAEEPLHHLESELTVHSDADSVGSLPRRNLKRKSQAGRISPGRLQQRQKQISLSSVQIGLQVQTSVSAAQDLLAVPHSSSFLDRLNAVDAELNCSAPYTFSQSLDKKAADDGEDTGCLACRTRSKLPLVNIPLGQLEAALLAPDITADMYEQSAAQREEDRHWAQWLQGLLDPDNLGSSEEADDDDDPEYNFVDDLEKPDKEDYRTDRAVQITRKEVNELLEELFQSEGTVCSLNSFKRRKEADEEASSQTGPNFNTPQALCFEMPLAEMLTEQRRTLRKQYESVQQSKASLKQIAAITPVLMMPGLEVPSLHLNSAQKLQLQQQMQQHVQLLTQVHLLCRNQDSLKHEACTT